VSNAPTTNASLATSAANTGYIGERNDATQINRLLINFTQLTGGGTIPTTATILSASMFMYERQDLADNASTLEIYPLLVSFNPAQATWNIRSTGNNWNTAGAGGAGTDYDNTKLIGSRNFSASETINEWKEIVLDPS